MRADKQGHSAVDLDPWHSECDECGPSPGYLVRPSLKQNKESSTWDNVQWQATAAAALTSLLLAISSDLIPPSLTPQQETYIVRLDGAAQNF